MLTREEVEFHRNLIRELHGIRKALEKIVAVGEEYLPDSKNLKNIEEKVKEIRGN